MPPSDSATLRFGNLWKTGEISRSTVAHLRVHAEQRDGRRRTCAVRRDGRRRRRSRSAGDSGMLGLLGGARGTGPSGRCGTTAGRAGAGASGKETALAPLAAVRSISATDGVDVPERHHHQRDLAAGRGRAPLVEDEVVAGADARGGELLVRRPRRTSLPAKPGNVGKHIWACTPSMSMSAMRAVDVVAARAACRRSARVEPEVLAGPCRRPR